jgi:hypothetical protein
MRWGDPEWLFPACPIVHERSYERAMAAPGFEIMFWLFDGGAQVYLVEDQLVAWRLRIRVARPAGALLNGEPVTALPLDSEDWPLAGPLGDGRAHAHGFRPRAAQALDPAWDRIAAHLRAAAHARLVEVARPFHPTLQWFVYCAAANDYTGRVAQMATTCPGLLGLASSLRSRESIFRGVVAGQRLRPLLALALESWAMQEDTRQLHLGRRLLGERLENEPDLIGRQRLLLRRATPAVAPGRLFRAPPLAFAPEDIPADPMANARWFQRMKASALLWPSPHLPERAHDGLCLLVSRHAGQADLEPARPAVWDREMDEVRDYLALTGRVPTRRGNLRELLAASRQWHAERHRPPAPVVPEDVQAMVDRLRAAAPALPAPAPEPAPPPSPSPDSFPPPPFEDWPPPARQLVPGAPPPTLVVRAIRSSAELDHEGAQMHHCVASYREWILAGKCAIYRVQAAGRRLTLEVMRQGDHWVLGDVKASHNHAPGKRAWEALAPWLELHGLGR